jgi:hypothetical protein
MEVRLVSTVYAKVIKGFKVLVDDPKPTWELLRW